MLINRVVERARALGLRDRRLADRARAARELPPLVLVPPMLGTRLRDADGRPVWGWTRSVFLGRSAESPEPVRLDGVLRELTLLPGVLAYGVHGTLIRYLVRIGGYRETQTLFPVAYAGASASPKASPRAPTGRCKCETAVWSRARRRPARCRAGPSRPLRARSAAAQRRSACFRRGHE